MDNEQESHVPAVFAGIGILVAAGAVLNHYRKVRVEEKIKRDKIKAWTAENLACIENYRQTLTDLTKDPNTTPEDFWTAYAYETKFLLMMQNRPMY